MLLENPPNTFELTETSLFLPKECWELNIVQVTLFFAVPACEVGEEFLHFRRT
jgi:hypothetical protein